MDGATCTVARLSTRSRGGATRGKRNRKRRAARERRGGQRGEVERALQAQPPCPSAPRQQSLRGRRPARARHSAVFYLCVSVRRATSQPPPKTCFLSNLCVDTPVISCSFVRRPAWITIEGYTRASGGLLRSRNRTRIRRIEPGEPTRRTPTAAAVVRE